MGQRGVAKTPRFVLVAAVTRHHVVPGHGRARLHGDMLRSERELVDVHLQVRSLRQGSGKPNRHCKTRDSKHGRDTDLACHCYSPQRCSGWSMIASRCCPRLKVTSVTPSTERSLSSATFIGPGEGAVPGAGCGKAVDNAVWKVTLPSTFCITWWMWPFNTVTEPKPLR